MMKFPDYIVSNRLDVFYPIFPDKVEAGYDYKPFHLNDDYIFETIPMTGKFQRKLEVTRKSDHIPIIVETPENLLTMA